MFGFAEASENIKIVSLSGSIYAEYCSNVCHPPATVRFELRDTSGGIIFKGQTFFEKNGEYSIPGLIAGETYTIEINDSSYLRMTLNIAIPFTDKYNELSRDFLVTPKKIGAELFFEVSPFKYKTSKLKEGFNTFNDRITELIRQNPDINFEISCFPENDIDEDYNQTITLERCRTLKEYFVKKGIDSSRLTENPNSKTDPMFPPTESKGPKGRRYTGSTYLIIK